MIERRFSAVALITCMVVFVLSIAASGMVWADSYSLSGEIQSGPSFGFLAGPIDVDVRHDGMMYVADQSNRRVLQFNEYGEFVFGCLFPPGFLPIAISLDHTGNFYYVSRFKGVLGYDIIRLPASSSCTSTRFDSPPGGFNSPFGITASANGGVYVADTNNDRILRYNPAGVFVDEWGGRGNDDGEFQTPFDIAYHSPTGAILVADTGNDRLQAFAGNGFFLGKAGTTGTGPLEFNLPQGIGVGPDGAVFVSDTGNDRIQKGYLDGTWAGEFGNSDLFGPNGLAVDAGGNVSVADLFNDRIAEFQPDLLVFDNGAESKVVTMPAPVTVTLDILPDAYWSNVPSELFAWAEGALGKAFLARYPLTGSVEDWQIFGSFLEVRPFLALRMTTLTGIVANILDNSSGLGGDWKLTVCFDRKIDGILNPSSSVCDSINVTIQ